MSSELLSALQRCSLHPLLIITSKVLTREGFGDVQILDRRESRQKSRFGGHEILCEGIHAGRPVKVVVKVIGDSIRTRMLDELCGTVDRMGADFGILVSPFTVRTSKRLLSRRYRRSRIEILDGQHFERLLLKHRIGVRGGAVDYAFFGELELVTRRLRSFLGKEAHGRS